MRKIYTLALALACTASAFAQHMVSTDSVKHVLLEEGTGAWCQYCPDGQVKMFQILDNTANQGRVVAVALHDGDAMAVPAINTMIDTYTPNWPNGAVDRKLETTTSKVFCSRTYWQSLVTQQLSVAPGFKIDLSHDYNNTTKVVDITIKVKTLTAQTGDYNINCYIAEDSVTGTGSGYNQINAFNTTVGHPYYGAGNPIVGFIHRHVARAILGGSWGTTGVITTNPAAGSTFTKTYTYTLPTSSSTGYKRFKIVAFIQKHDVAVPHNRIIKNAIEAEVTPGIATGVEELSNTISEFSVYPNPATDNVYVTGLLNESADVNIAVINTIGQTVIEKNYSKLDKEFIATLSLENLTSGIYFVTVSTKDTKRTERIVVNR